jgi:RNA polymerase sigma factor (sigma-70 family)
MAAVDTTVAAGEQADAAPRAARARPARADAEPAVLELLRRHGGRLMSVARRYSSSREDAEDAYQRAVEILLTRAPSTDPAELLPWTKTVVKHEAFAVGRQRARHGTPSESEQIEPFAGLAAGPAELAERRDRLRLGAEALGRLKPQEVRALLLRAEGLSYHEICAATGWSYTKVNRCLSEGRRSFLDRVARIEGGDECARLAPFLSALADGEASAADVAALRPHLRGCLACRARLREYRRAPARAAAAVVPVGAAASLWGALRGAAHAAAGRLQDVPAAVQAATVPKVAAVAASTAVLAGGGAATVGALDGGADHPRARERGSAAERRSAPALTGVSPFRPTDPARRRAAGARRWESGGGTQPQHQSHSPRPRPSPAPAPPPQGEFAPGPAPTGGSGAGSPPASSPPPSTAPPPAAEPGEGGEFAP